MAHCGGDIVGIPQGCALGKPCPIGIVPHAVAGALDRQARLAAATRSGERHQAVGSYRSCNCSALSLATDEARTTLGEVRSARKWRAQRSEIRPQTGSGQLEDARRGIEVLEPKLAQLAKGNLAFAVGLMVLLMVVTVVYLPLVLPLLLSGVSVDSGKIARSLVLVMLLPLAVGLVAKTWLAAAGERIRSVLLRIANVSLILFTLLLIIVNFRSVLGIFGTRGILGGLLFIAISFGIGWFLGGPDPDGRRVVALGTAQRNIAAAIVVGGQSFTDPKVVVMVVVVAIVGLLILMPLSPRLAT